MIEAKIQRSFPVRLIVVGIFTFGLGALILYLTVRSYVKTLDDDAVTVRSGKRYAWGDLTKIKPVYVRRYGRTTLNHVDLMFSGGTAGVYYQMFENGAEVLGFVRKKTNQAIPFAL